MMSSLWLMHRMILKSQESAAKPTGVEVDAPQETYFDDGLGQQDEAISPIQIPPAVPEDPAPSHQGMAARNARVRKPPEKYVPNMKGNKYAASQEGIVDLTKKNDAQYVLYIQTVYYISQQYIVLQSN
jgi:hypothetical protein